MKERDPKTSKDSVTVKEMNEIDRQTDKEGEKQTGRQNKWAELLNRKSM